MLKEQNTSSIALLTCWFGPYPWYFSYFIHSCSFNPTIDFIIVTDNTDLIEDKPENVRIVYKTLAQIQEVAFHKLGFEVNIGRPYKLCDFKPTYGFLFPEIVGRYDFWGHADIDLVYGNIRNFMTEEILKDNEVITCRHDYISGTFSLFRNNEKVNTLFMKSKDYEKVLSSPDHYCFDECSFLCEVLREGGSIFDYTHLEESMTYVVQDEVNKGRLKAYFDFIIIEGTPGEVKWDKGMVVYKEQYEALLYHLIKFKTECKEHEIRKPIPDSFYFTPNEIVTTIH